MKKLSLFLIVLTFMLLSCKPEIEKPTVVTKSVVEITETTAMIVGEVTADGGGEVSERGVCWSVNENPTIEDDKITESTGLGIFTSNILNLVPNTQYYVRAYAINEAGISYGEELNFTTEEEKVPEEPEDEGEQGTPIVATIEVSEISYNSAVGGGNVTSDGGVEVTARGVCWSIKPNPTIKDDKTVDGTGVGSYSSNITNLEENTTYYVRAYATNEVGTSYGEEMEFVTMVMENDYQYVDLGLPSGLKWATCNVGANSPEEYGDYYAWGEVNAKEEYTEVCCSTYGVQMNDISGDAQYDVARLNWGGDWRMPTYAELDELQTKCIWSWSVQNGVNGYNVVGPNGNSIFLPAAGYRYGSSLYSAGNDGCYWGATPYDYDDEYTDALFFYIDYQDVSVEIAGNIRSMGLSVRPVIGDKIETPIVQYASVSTSEITEITSSSAMCGGDVKADGGAEVKARGICWSMMPNPTIEDNNTVEGNGIGNFTSNLSDLVPQTTYYVRAYAINEAGTSYGEEKVFITLKEDIFDETVEIITANGVSFNMISVEGGIFQMGATTEQDSDAYDDEAPIHNVTLSDYYIGETEVTQELWTAVMGNNPSCFAGNSQRPVEYVSWDDCQEFITKLNQLTGKRFRLPTEAEWEYAARGGNKSQAYKYSGSNAIEEVAWYMDNSGDATHDVKSKSPNELGIYDMNGNVWEWCQDWYGDYTSDSQVNPQGPTNASYRVLRGGGWINRARQCRATYRNYQKSTSSFYYTGLRIAISK